MKPTEARFREVFNALESHIERRYGIPVRISDVPHPFTGDLDGAEIQVDHAVTLEDAVFIVAHLFGHTVQWNLSPQAREIGRVVPVNPPASVLAEIAAYEREACAYSLSLFHELGIQDLDQWLSDFAACDYAYLEHFYRTGEKRPFKTFWMDDRPLLSPIPIPRFNPTQWHSRWKGVVV